MKKLISYTMTALFATIAVSIASPEKGTIEAKEKAVWQAFKDKKPEEAKKLLSPQLMSVYADGINTMQDELAAMQKMQMKSFSLSRFRVAMTDADTAIVTYRAKVVASAGGTDLSGTYNAGSVWQKKDGNWLGVFHSEMKAQEPVK